MRNLAPLDLRKTIRRLMDAGYTFPSSTSEEALSRVWAEVFSGLTATDVHMAAGSYINQGSIYWPKPGQLLAIALKERSDRPGVQKPLSVAGNYYAWENHHRGACPVCGARLQLHGQPQRYQVVHDPRQHQRAGVPHVGLPDTGGEKRDDGPQRIEAESRDVRLLTP